MAEKAYFEVYSMLGSKVLSGNLMLNAGIDVSGLESGMCLVRLSGDGGDVRRLKIIKE